MTVIGASGHQQIPPLAIPIIRARIAAVLANAGSDIVGVCSLAAGADQLFAQEILDAGGHLHVVIPSDHYASSFVEEVDRERYERLLGVAFSVETLPFETPCEDAYLAAGHRVIDVSDVLVAVWDGLPALGKGGTGDAVDYANAARKMVVIVWPEGLKR